MNLMCPARLILLPAGSPATLAGHRIAMVYASPSAEGAAALLGDRLGARVSVVPEFREVAGESDDDAVRRSEAALSGIADLHRGETVVVVAPGLSLGLPLGSGVVELEHDGYGWTVVPDSNAVTLAAYEQAAERFRATIPSEPGQVLLDQFDLIDTRLHPGATVLELGSGTGRDALELERRGYRVRRTDAAESFVEMMRSDGHHADRLNALTDEFGGPYDLVFADAVLLHFDRDQLAAVLRKAARASGLLAFSLREGEGAEWSTRHLDLPRHFTMWQEPELRRLLTDCGWTIASLARGSTPVGGWFYVLAERTTPPRHDGVTDRTM
ncbi:MAG TPA: methyltransferase domain-containing protein [Kribbella sp.]|nr:methyltransferase domain-containing protein [Kribbella sp.]